MERKTTLFIFALLAITISLMGCGQATQRTVVVDTSSFDKNSAAPQPAETPIILVDPPQPTGVPKPTNLPPSAAPIPASTSTPVPAPMPTPIPTPTPKGSALLPAGSPIDTTELGGYEISTYADGTVAVNGGKWVILPDSSIYMDDVLREHDGYAEISDGEVARAEIPGGVVVLTNDPVLYVAANDALLVLYDDLHMAAYLLP